MNRSVLALITTALLATAAPASAATTTESLLDDSRTVKFTWWLENGSLSYGVASLAQGKETSVVERSPLGIICSDSDFSSGLSFVTAEPPRAIDETYTLTAGKRREIRNHAREQAFTFKNAAGATVDLVVRAMDDGVAFRYGFPKPSGPNMQRLVTGESTGFKLPLEGSAWMLPYDKVDTWAPSYEAAWTNKIAIGTTAENWRRGWAFPALFQTRGQWVMLTEAGIDGTCYGAHLEAEAKDGLYRIRLPEDEETYGVAANGAKIELPWLSPWRLIVVGSSPGTILETNIVTDLSPPCEYADTSWIKPGRVSWSWWSDKSSPSDYNRLVPFIDLSAEYGWEYSLIDGGWEYITNGSIEALADYAKHKKVGLILWYNSGGPHNKVIYGLRDRMHDPVVRATEMAWLERLGIKGIKVDFMQSDKQYMMQLYLDILRDAAKHHLVVDFHGATMPRGWERTLPNHLTMEGIRGAEQYWDADFAEHAHTFHTIYPFTRNAVGSMDYTPVIFGAAPELQWHKTTNAHELALSVAFESGLQHFVDSVSAYRAQSNEVQQFLKDVPAAWDETRYVAGTPGELCVLARRKGDIWYLAALNGRAEPQTTETTLGFLGDGTYTAQLFTDGSWQKELKVESKPVTGADRLPLALAARGGATVRLVPKR